MERRKYPRLDVDLPMAYLTHSPDSGKSSVGMGVLKNISQGGMFFKCPPPLPIDDGDIRDFTIDTIPIMWHISRLKALGKVVRIESPEENYFDFGIAVQFLSDLIIKNPMKSYKPRIVLWDEREPLRRENSRLIFGPNCPLRRPKRLRMIILHVNNPCLYDLQCYT